jgi:hypothetical protein
MVTLIAVWLIMFVVFFFTCLVSMMYMLHNETYYTINVTKMFIDVALFTTALWFIPLSVYLLRL